MYIQKDLTTTPYELPGISWELTDALLEKFHSFQAFSKLVFNEDESEIIDIVENTKFKARVEADKKQKKQEEDLQRLAQKRYLPIAQKSANVLVRMLLPQVLPDADEIEVLRLSGLFEPWTPGNYKVGDVRNANDQTWECHQAHDNATYPDIKPDDPSWFTFWRPLHGKSPDTARKWVKPQHGTTDIYHAGEYMIYTDGRRYKCLSDTNFSPEEFSQAWETQEDNV